MSCSINPVQSMPAPGYHRRDPRFQQARPPVVNLDQLSESLQQRQAAQMEAVGDRYGNQTRSTPSTPYNSSLTERFDAYSRSRENYTHLDGENILNQALSAINTHHFPASIPLSPAMIDRFSQNSKESDSIRDWESRCKPVFETVNPPVAAGPVNPPVGVPVNPPLVGPTNPPVVDLDPIPLTPTVLCNVTSEPVRRAGEPNNASGFKLSDFLSKQMRPFEYNPGPEPVFSPTYAENVVPKEAQANANTPVYTTNISAAYGEKLTYPNVRPPVPTPVPKPIYPDKNVAATAVPVANNLVGGGDGGREHSKPAGGNKLSPDTEPKSSIRGKLSQEINVIHKAGDSSKIRGSLKVLKVGTGMSPNSAVGNSTPKEAERPEVMNGRVSANDPRLRRKSSDSRSTTAGDAGLVRSAESRVEETISLVNDENPRKESPVSGPNTTSPKVTPIKGKIRVGRPPGSIDRKHLAQGRNAPHFSAIKNLKKNMQHNNPFGSYEKHPKHRWVNTQSEINRKSSNIVPKVREKTEFLSPLSDIYKDSSALKTAAGYGPSKLSYKIPKKNVPVKFSPSNPFTKSKSPIKPKVQNIVPLMSKMIPKPNSSTVNHVENKSNEPPTNNDANVFDLSKTKKKRRRKRIITPVDESDDTVDTISDVKNEDPIEAGCGDTSPCIPELEKPKVRWFCRKYTSS